MNPRHVGKEAVKCKHERSSIQVARQRAPIRRDQSQ